MVAFDALEQLHPAALQPKHADTIADLGPFGIEVSLDELLGKATDLETSRLDMTPVCPSTMRERNRAAEQHRLPGKSAEMFGRLIPASRLIEAMAVDADHAVAADHPFAGEAHRLRLCEPKRNLARVRQAELEFVLVDLRLCRLIFDARGIETRSSAWARHSSG